VAAAIHGNRLRRHGLPEAQSPRSVIGRFSCLIVKFISLFVGFISLFGRIGNLPARV
jgi:hypothetical protein